MEKFFKLRESGTTVSTEIMAGLTTFFTMAYIIAVNPSILSQTGMEWGAVFLATIIASIIGTLIMGLVANVPYAQAPGMGLNAFFTYTVCFGLGFTWQQALSMVFICGLINILITVTKLRKYIIKAIPKSLQNAIGGGIGVFVAYIGLLNVGIISFDSGVPAIATLNQPVFWLFLIGLVLTIVLLVCNVKGAILIGIVVTAIIGIPMGVTATGDTISFKRSLRGASDYLRRDFHRSGSAVPVYGYGKAASGAHYHFCLQHFRYPLIPSEPSSEPDAVPASSAKRMRRQWIPAPDSSPRWTRRSLRMLRRPPSARSSERPTPPPSWKALPVSERADVPV